MKPYYEADGVTIYHGDCREVLLELDLAGSVVFTDPPYGIGLDYGHVDNWRPDVGFWRQIWNGGAASLHFTSSNRHLFEWLQGVTSAGWRYLHCSVYWNRNRAGGNGNGQMAYAWEPWLSFDRADAPLLLAQRMLSDVFPFVSAEQTTDHPAERNLNVWRSFLGLLPGHPIVDPFMGSGTTLRAAKDLGRRAIGIEVEERYCELAAQRLGQMVLAL